MFDFTGLILIDVSHMFQHCDCFNMVSRETRLYLEHPIDCIPCWRMEFIWISAYEGLSHCPVSTISASEIDWNHPKYRTNWVDLIEKRSKYTGRPTQCKQPMNLLWFRGIANNGSTILSIQWRFLHFHRWSWRCEVIKCTKFDKTDQFKLHENGQCFRSLNSPFVWLLKEMLSF